MAKKLARQAATKSHRQGRAEADARRPRRTRPKAAQKYVYFFGGGKADGNGKMKELLGGKGANLAEMCRIGLPVPAGFTITTEVCTYYYANKRKYPAEAEGRRSKPASRKIEKQSWARSSATRRTRCSSPCRSGARDSMPGMMDTVLNIGLNDQTVAGLVEQDRQRALRLGQLSPLRPDVRRRRARPAKPQTKTDRPVRDGHRRAQARALYGDIEDTDLTVDDLQGTGQALQGGVKERDGQGLPRRPVGADAGAPSAPCSAPG